MRCDHEQKHERREYGAAVRGRTPRAEKTGAQEGQYLHADHRARPARPAQKQRDLSAEAVAQCGDEGNHKIIKRK